MANLKTISDDLTKSLGLKYPPAGVRLYKNQELTPANIPFTEDSLKSYCQALYACHLMMGIPGDMLEIVHAHILDMAKPIARLKNAQLKT